MLGPVLFVAEIVALAVLGLGLLLVLTSSWRKRFARELVVAVVMVAVAGAFIAVSFAMRPSWIWPVVFAAAAACFGVAALAMRVLPEVLARRRAASAAPRTLRRPAWTRLLAAAFTFALVLAAGTCLVLLSHANFVVEALRDEARGLLQRIETETDGLTDAGPVYASLASELDAATLRSIQREPEGASVAALFERDPRLIERLRDASRLDLIRELRPSGAGRPIDVCWGLVDAHARWAVARGDTKAALEDVLAAVAMAEQICMSPTGGREGFRRGVERMERSVETLAWIFGRPNFDPARGAEIALAPGAELLAAFGRVAMLDQSQALEEIAKFGESSRGRWGADVFVRFVVPHEALILRGVTGPFHGALSRYDLAEFIKFTRATFEHPPESFVAGEAARRLCREPELAVRPIALRRLISVAFAVQAFRARTGRPPAVLLDLVPVPFRSAPEDPITGEPIRLELRDGVCTIGTTGLEPLADGEQGYPGERMRFAVGK